MIKNSKKIIATEKKVIQFLNRNKGTYYKQKNIAKSLKIPASQYPDFKRLLKNLSENEKIERSRKNRYSIPDLTRNIIGIISFSGRGFAFVNTDSGDEIFIGTYDVATAFQGDKVSVLLYKKQRGKRPEGKVIKILKRANEPLFAILRKDGSRWEAIPESPAPPVNIVITGSYEKIREGQMVELTNLEWSDPKNFPRGEIKQILGIPANPLDDIIIVKKMYRLSEIFPKKVMAEVNSIKIPDIKKLEDDRLDLRKEELFTIDPVDALDFDDAISLQKNEYNEWLLGVHIADVSYFVNPAGAIEREARKRGTSVYIGDQVVPMLPEKLSNELCSLKPGVDRLTFSVIMKLSPNAELIDFSISPSIINSKKRFSYQEAQDILEQGNGQHYETLFEMRNLARILFTKRSSTGSIDFDIPEPHFIIGKNGIPKDIVPSERLDTHKLVEEFMLLANKTVAEWISFHRKKENLPFIYRVHEPPPQDAVDGLYETLQRLGMDFSKPKNFMPAHLRDILADIQGMPYRNFVEQISLRSMQKAVYTHHRSGHFGLAFNYYTHFTSPIRRYPDLLVHRLLKLYSKEFTKQDVSYYRHAIPKIAKSCCNSELRALRAEREYIKLKQIRFIASKIGKWYEGIITGIIEHGFFVEISEFLVEGFVPVRTLEDDYYIFDKTIHCLIGRKYHRNFRLGDYVNVQVASVSLKEKRIDFRWGE